MTFPEDPEVYIHRIGRTARMGAKGKAFTFVTKEQGEELTKVESLINMIVPQAQLDGFTPTPPPDDWTDAKPGMRPGEGAGPAGSKPIVSRFERAYGSAGNAQPSVTGPTAEETSVSSASTAPAPRRTLGSKIPINRRHKRRR